MSEKKYDAHNRFRCLSVGFRASPEESQQIDLAVALSGLTKREYIINKLLDRKITVTGNSKIHKAVYEQLTAVLTELKRIESGKKVDDELLADIMLITSVIDSLYLKDR